MANNNDKILKITETLTLIGSDKVLDKKTGNILKINDPKVKKEIENFMSKNTPVATSVNTNWEVVYSLTSQKIDLTLKTSDGPIEPKVGFLIEVYNSGSDGKLKRLYKEDLEDPLDGNNVISDGFSNYFNLEIDV